MNNGNGKVGAPKPYLWPKGVSGNQGSPGRDLVTKWAKKLLKRNDGELGRILAESLIQRAISGDKDAVAAARLVLERVEGPIKHEGDVRQHLECAPMIVLEPQDAKALRDLEQSEPRAIEVGDENGQHPEG